MSTKHVPASLSRPDFMPRRRSALAAIAACVAAPAFAQSSGRSMTLVVPTAAGGASDAVARALGTIMATTLGHPVVVENKLGAGGSIAAAAVARAAPDGMTLLVGSSATHGANPSLFKTLAYDPVKDFEPVALLGSFLFGVVVHPQVPASSMKELIAYAKANPGKLTYAGVSSTSIAMTETLLRGTGVDILKIPHKSASLALPDLVSGRISMGVIDVATAAPMVREGALKLLAITSRQRSALFPQTPTIAETVLPDFEVESWIGLFAPAGTPAPLVEKLNAAAQEALARLDVKTRAAALAFDIRTGSVESFRRSIPVEIAKFTKLIKAAGISAE